MMLQLLNAAAVLTLPTSDSAIQAGLTGSVATSDRQEVWIVIENVTPHLFQLLDEEGSVLDIIWPWSNNATRLRPANERRIVSLHPVVKLSAAATTPVGVWVEVSTLEPMPSAGGGGTA